MKSKLLSQQYTYLTAAIGAVLVLPVVVSAQVVGGTDLGQLGEFIENVSIFITTTLVPLVYSLAFLAFVWGVFRYFIFGAGNEENREAGKSLMIYSILGFLLITVIWGLVNFIVDTLGLRLDDPLLIDQLFPETPNVPNNSPSPGGTGGPGGGPGGGSAGGTGGPT